MGEMQQDITCFQEKILAEVAEDGKYLQISTGKHGLFRHDHDALSFEV